MCCYLCIYFKCSTPHTRTLIGYLFGPPLSNKSVSVVTPVYNLEKRNLSLSLNLVRSLHPASAIHHHTTPRAKKRPVGRGGEEGGKGGGCSGRGDHPSFVQKMGRHNFFITKQHKFNINTVICATLFPYKYL